MFFFFFFKWPGTWQDCSSRHSNTVESWFINYLHYYCCYLKWYYLSWGKLSSTYFLNRNSQCCTTCLLFNESIFFQCKIHINFAWTFPKSRRHSFINGRALSVVKPARTRTESIELNSLLTAYGRNFRSCCYRFSDVRIQFSLLFYWS